MAGVHKLGRTDTGIRGMLEPGRYADGGGLYLQVAAARPASESKEPRVSKCWIFRYRADGREREMGLGAYPVVGLAEARAKAEACRRMRDDGVDPLAAREAQRTRNAVEEARATSFRQCAEAYIAAHEGAWRNPKHRQQWRNTLKTYVYPLLAELPVSAIDTPLVLKVLEEPVSARDPATGKLTRRSIWETKPETAGRVRGRIESILDWAKARKYREGENPAAWRGNLIHALPSRGKVRTVKHHPALPYRDLPAFMGELAANTSISAEALRFTILTAARTDEVLRADWAEFDLIAALWKVPETRMKKGREHWVPLSDAALAILHARREATGGVGFVFPGAKRGRPLSNMAMLELLRGMREGVTVHGFRSTFRDWAGEVSNFPREVIEHALAHQLKDKAEAAYARGTLLEKRRRLMSAWATYCAPKNNVVSLTDARAAG